MSDTESFYEPSEEDEEVSEEEPRASRSQHCAYPASSPLLEELRLSPSKDDRRRTQSRTRGPARSRSRAQARRALNHVPIEGYRKLLAEQLDDYESSRLSESRPTSFLSSQYGVVTWTPREKELLFDLLSLKGGNDARTISSKIGTKSEPEVRHYLQLLRNGLEHQHLNETHTRSIVLSDIPAAAEISEECREALDQAAQALEMKIQAEEDVSGKRIHGAFWTIDQHKAKAIEEETQEQGPDEIPQSSIMLSASLLNIGNWLEVSNQFFMNPGEQRLEDNWTNLAFEGESPSLTSDAFADFYSLTVSLTRRLVQSSIFFAMSRIRALQPGTHSEKAKVVRRQDVYAALDVLKMKHDSSEFWKGMAKRCSLGVLHDAYYLGEKRRLLSYEEVEKELSKRISRKKAYSSKEMGELSSSDSGEEDEVNNESSNSGSSPASTPPQSPEASPEYEDPEESYAEVVDRQFSKAEELRLWEVLETLPPEVSSKVKAEDDSESIAAMTKPVGERKSREDLVDWRERTVYRSEWETYGREMFDIYEALDINRRKRRREDDDEIGLRRKRGHKPSSAKTPEPLDRHHSDGEEQMDIETKDTEERRAQSSTRRGDAGSIGEDSSESTAAASEDDSVPETLADSDAEVQPDESD